MSARYLSHVTLETLENYRNAATQGVRACRSGSQRLVGAVLRGNVSRVAIKGLDQTAARAQTAIEFGADAAGTQLNKFARFAARFDNPVVANGLQTVARLTMPGAKVALAISGKVSAGATALADAAGARPLRRAAGRAAEAAKAPLAKARRTRVTVKRAVKRAARG